MENVIIIGSSGQAKVVIDIIEKEKKYNIIGLLDRFRKVGEETLSYKVLGREEDIPKLIEKYNLKGGIIAVGDNWARYTVYKNISNIYPKFNYIKAIHPSAQIGKNVEIGKGTVIMPGVTINSNTKIGEFCILNTNCSIDHDNKMGNFSSIAPNGTTGGNVFIDGFSAVSLGAKVIHKIKIGKHSVIGAGSLILKDIPDFKVAYGVPAKVIKSREIGDSYL